MLKIELIKNNKKIQTLKGDKFSNLYYMIRKNYNLITITRNGLFEYTAIIG